LPEGECYLIFVVFAFKIGSKSVKQIYDKDLVEKPLFGTARVNWCDVENFKLALNLFVRRNWEEFDPEV